VLHPAGTRCSCSVCDTLQILLQGCTPDCCWLQRFTLLWVKGNLNDSHGLLYLRCPG
jgi:hypothetical protein